MDIDNDGPFLHQPFHDSGTPRNTTVEVVTATPHMLPQIDPEPPAEYSEHSAPPVMWSPQEATERDPLRTPKKAPYLPTVLMSPQRTGSTKSRVSIPDGLILPDCLGGYHLSRVQAVMSGVAFILCGGILLGSVLPTNTHDPAPYSRISSIVGWIYFFAWSVSFYPQIYSNWIRNSVEGMSFDFVLLNVVGFACYSAYNVAYYWIGVVQHEYWDLHHHRNVVRSNDVFFALHAELLCLITLSQIFFLDRGEQKFHWGPLLAVGIATFIFSTWAFCIMQNFNHGKSPFMWMDWLLYLSYFKLAISIVKYLPQAYLNWERQSTTGWNIWNVLLDFTGGLMSVAQVLMDCATQNDWSGISGDPVKFGLGFCSIVFDTVFIIQHYILYAENNRAIHEREEADAAESTGDPELQKFAHRCQP